MGPAYYVRQLLRSQDSIEQIWRGSPSNNGNTMTLTSQRSQGFSERLDPDRPNGGYYRSLVSQGVSSNQVRSGATGTFSGTTAGILRPPVTPSLVSLGLTFGSIDVRTAPIAATRSQLIVPVAAKGAKKIPDGTKVGIRWDPIMLDAKPASSSGGTSPPAASASPSPSTSTSPAPSGTVAPSASPAPIDPPDVNLVVPEQLGSVVTLAPAARTGKGLNVDVTYPSAPGLYRLVMTLHDAAGVAYDAPDAVRAQVGDRPRRRPVLGGLRGSDLAGARHRRPRRPSASAWSTRARRTGTSRPRRRRPSRTRC